MHALLDLAAHATVRQIDDRDEPARAPRRFP